MNSGLTRAIGRAQGANIGTRDCLSNKNTYVLSIRFGSIETNKNIYVLTIKFGTIEN